MTRTRQEIFDIAYRGLKSQGFRRSGNDDECWYRGPDGLKCAVGYLIADEDYKPEFEGKAADWFEVLAAANASSDDRLFLERLQIEHDEAPSPDVMKAHLADFAGHYGLTIPEDAA